MKKYRVIILLFVILTSCLLIGCDFEDGVLVIDFDKTSESGQDNRDNTKGDGYTAQTETKAENSDESSTVSCAHQKTEYAVISEANCADVGYIQLVCVDCHQPLSEAEEIAPYGHTGGDWMVEKEPTATEEGIRYTFCLTCDERLEDTIDPLGYSEGLAFKSGGDGTCAAVGIGECKDTVIYIPPTSPDGDVVVAIGMSAFAENTNIRSIYMPETVIEVGAGAFYCADIENVYFSDNILKIGNNAFFGCFNLKDFDFPKSLQIIEYHAFNSCTSLTEITIPNGVTDIGEMAFAHCTGVKHFNIPSSVETIGEGAISANNIEEITVARENPNFKVVNNCLVGKDGLLIVGYGECSIPSGVSIIGYGAFAGNADISSIIIPSEVKEIRENAFINSSISEITIPYGVRLIENQAFILCERLEKVTLYTSVKSIGYWAFDKCPNLSEIVYYGTLEEWNGIDIHEDNEGLFAAQLTVIGGVSPETVYGYGRTTISGNEAVLYDLLEASIMADEPISKVKIDISEKITIEDFYTARTVFMSDHPECFWWDGVISYTATQQEGYINSIEFQYTYSGDTLAVMRSLLEEKVGEILSSLPDGSIFDKMLYLHDEVARSVVYERTPHDQTPYGALVEGRAVCNGYATAYQMLLQRAGIRAWTVNGYAGGEAHAWNVVWLDDSVCVYTDVTWNDSEEYISHYYFNMSYREISEEHFTNDVFDLPECEHSQYGYYDLSPDASVLLQKDSASKLCSFLKEGEDGSLTAIFLFNGYSFEEWLDANGSDLSEELGGFSVEYYTTGYEIFVIFTK